MNTVTVTLHAAIRALHGLQHAAPTDAETRDAAAFAETRATYAEMGPLIAAFGTGNVRPGAVWGKRYEWTRNADGTVTVRNPRTRCYQTFPHIGAALTLARDTKANAAFWANLRRMVTGR